MSLSFGIAPFPGFERVIELKFFLVVWKSVPPVWR